MSEITGPNLKTKSENGSRNQANGRTKNHKTRRPISENTTDRIRKQGGRKSENEKQKEPLQCVRIPMLLETALLYRSAALHC